MFVVQNHRIALTTLQKRYDNAVILDVTSQGKEPWVRFSPFYPHHTIPVPFSPGYTSASVEGIWQGLKVFERADVDLSKFQISMMKGIKRSTRTLGKIIGHRKGVTGDQLLSYHDARFAIYLPVYYWVLEHILQNLLEDLKNLESGKTTILLDYETNCDVNVLTKPLSHAGLIKLYLEGNWPSNTPVLLS